MTIVKYVFFYTALFIALFSGTVKAEELRSLTISAIWPDQLVLEKRADGIISNNIDLPEKYDLQIREFFGKKITQDNLQAIQNAVYYAAYETGYPLASIGFPQQDFNDGHLYLYVPSGNVRQIGIDGDIQTSASYLTSFIRQRPNKPLDSSALQADLDVLNATGQRAWLSTTPTGDPAWVDVTIDMREKNPWNGYLSYDDSGSDNSGRYRVKAGASYGNLWNKGHKFSYNFNADGDFNNIRGHSISYSGLLPWRHVIEAFASYNDSDSDLVSGNQIIEQNQKSKSFGINYKVPMRQYWPKIGGTLRTGAVFKDAEFTSLSTPGPQRPGSQTHIFNLLLGYNAPIPTPLGNIYSDTSIAYSPGGIGNQNTDSDFALSRVGAEASYLYAKTSLRHYTQLPQEFLLTTKLEGQLSSTNLLSSERLSAGGQFSLRGFQQGLVQGDEGIIWGTELAIPQWQYNLETDIPRINDVSLQPVVFYEGGYLETKKPSTGESNRSLQSIGGGLRFNMGDVVSFRYDYGHQLDDSGFDDGENGRHHFRLTASF